jgi:hypothetical protein
MTTNAEGNADNKSNVQAPPENPKQSDKEFNFAQLRKQMEAERAEKEEWRRKAEEAEKLKIRSTDDNDDNDYSDEPYVDEKRLQKKFAKFEERFAKKVDEQAEAKARMLIEAEKQNSFLKANPDFQDILREDIIQKFAETHPDIAEPMLEMPNNFARQKLLYQNIKALGVHKPKPDTPSIQDTINKNLRSPYYQPSGVANAPYAAAGDFSDHGQKNAYQKMKDLQKKLRL